MVVVEVVAEAVVASMKRAQSNGNRTSLKTFSAEA